MRSVYSVNECKVRPLSIIAPKYYWTTSGGSFTRLQSDQFVCSLLECSMEETVRTLLQNQDSPEGPKVDPLDLMKAYKDKLLEEMWKQQDSLEGSAATAAGMPTSPEAGGGSEENSKDSNPLLERLRALEAENSALSMENDNQRKQYERCLDEDLKEECVKLRTRVFDLEQQNRILSVLFQQRVKMSTIPVSQEVQRNGKAGIPAGRWPSLLSLTCPRSSGSGSGSELSLSSVCSEYSSGSHTWAEGRGFSKQSAASRDKRMRTSSVSSNHSVSIEQADLGWKEGHILKGLKRLQMYGSKEKSSLASVPQCKDCMTSNEGIYSLGFKCGLQESTAKHVAPASKLFKVETRFSTLDSDDADDDSSKSQNKESHLMQPTKEFLCLEKLNVTRDDDGNFQEEAGKLAGDCGVFPSPVTDNFLFLDSPTVKPGVSPTDSLTHQEDKNKDSLEKHKTSGLKFSDRNNNQERSADRKSRLDHIKRQQGRHGIKHLGTGTSDVSLSIQHTATRAISCMNEARQRSSSVEVGHCRDQASQTGGESQDYTMSDSQQRKPKPQPCDSARKAFILRSKSADAGPEQVKLTHSPLHQKLIKGHKSKEQTQHSGHSGPGKRTNLNRTHGSSKGELPRAEKDEDVVVSANSKSLDSLQQRSPLASPVKHSKTFKLPGVNECSKSPTKSSLQITRPQSSNESVEESIYDNLPCSPRKQRRQDQHCNGSTSEHRPPSPPLPPGRTTSLHLRPESDSLPKAHKSAVQDQSSTTGKTTSTTAKPPLNQVFSALQLQSSNTCKENQNIAPQMGAEGNPLKDVPPKVYHTHSSKIQPVSVQESQSSDSVQLTMDRTVTGYDGNDNSSILPNKSILQRSQQSISEPKLSEVLPQAYSNVYYHGIASNSQNSTSRAVKMLPVNAKSHEAITGQEANTFLIFGRQNKDDANSVTKNVQTFQTFTCDPQMIHECGAHDKARRKIDIRCNSLDSEPSIQPVASDSGVMLDWGYDEEGWLFKRSVSVSTRPLLKPVMGMNGAKARSQSFGARYMDRPSFNRSGKVRTQIKTHSGSSLNSLGDVHPGTMSCSSSYHCPMNRSLLNNFLIEEGLTVPSHLGSSSERLQSLKLQREHARCLQIEQQFSSAFGEPVSEEPERQSTITTIEEKVMLGIEENMHKSQEQERSNEVKQKSGSTLANWFGFRKSKLPAPSGKKADAPKAKEDKREQKITSLLGGKQTKSDKKRDRRKSDGKDCAATRNCTLAHVRTQKSSLHGPDFILQATIVRSPGSGCKMRTLDSGIGTIPLPESCSFFSSILHLLPKSSSTPEQSLSPPSVPGSSSRDVSPLPRWRMPSSFKDSSYARVPNSLSDSSMTHIQSVPFPTVAFLQPIQPQSKPILTSASVFDNQSRLPRAPQGEMEPKMTYIKSKSRAPPSQQKEQTRLQLASWLALQIQCYQCEEMSHDCSTPEFIVNCTVNVQDMCQKEVLVKNDEMIKECAVNLLRTAPLTASLKGGIIASLHQASLHFGLPFNKGIYYRKSCASSGACLIASSGYQQFCTGKLNSVCITCCNTPLCNGPRQKKRPQPSAAVSLSAPQLPLLSLHVVFLLSSTMC
ncbi:Nck-associated protein 5 [Channa argus]|uniref:Nck-associated protein 5 n=1 Tax=Channa argus TaxID=215402 RepID=A0A6G1PYV2_CHAAH|nr:Nck-associated protein 5 [Channa argus]